MHTHTSSCVCLSVCKNKTSIMMSPDHHCNSLTPLKTVRRSRQMQFGLHIHIISGCALTQLHRITLHPGARGRRRETKPRLVPLTLTIYSCNTLNYRCCHQWKSLVCRCRVFVMPNAVYSQILCALFIDSTAECWWVCFVFTPVSAPPSACLSHAFDPSVISCLRSPSSCFLIYVTNYDVIQLFHISRPPPLRYVHHIKSM